MEDSMDLKQRGELKNLYDRIGRGAGILKRAVHSFDLKEENYLQMQEMVILTQRAAAIMDTLKPVQPDTSRQGILIDLDSTELVPGKVVYTEYEQDALEQEVHHTD